MAIVKGDSNNYNDGLPIATAQVIGSEYSHGGYQHDANTVKGTPVTVQGFPADDKQGKTHGGNAIPHGSDDPFNNTYATSNMNTDPHHVPHGHWRDGFCSWFANGLCHPLCCLSFWCTPLALGQVMTRSNLNWCARPTTRQTGMTAFKVLAIIFIGYIILDAILNYIKEDVVANGGSQSYDNTSQQGVDDIYRREESYYNEEQKAIDGVQSFLGAIIGVFLLYLMIKTRSHLRRIYSIPGNSLKDCCASFWCPCCTVSQMARHTADYDQYNAACCNDTGLSESAPHVNVPTTPVHMQH